ncbi:MAG: quinolinate synthase NadA [Clostridia bacterium]|nr:quinolinate synthase NadA [Clostridia bacterium]
MDYKQRIEKLKKEKNAVIVAHSYQPMEIQEIADVVGDSLELSKYCAADSAQTIVFCGVLFMAESAKILSPGKKVLLPEIDAGCPMADMVNAKSLRELKKKHPDATVVCYINSSAEVKAESDICCTSSNAVNIVKAVENNRIIFVPDKNLGSYVASMVPEKEIILWEGFCPVHDLLTAETIVKMKEAYPKAKVVAHPECLGEVLAKADYIGSTKKIIEYVLESSDSEFIIATEKGVVDRLQKMTVGKKIHLADTRMVCRNMKKNTIDKVINALENDIYEIHLDKDIIEAAAGCLNRMMELS